MKALIIIACCLTLAFVLSAIHVPQSPGSPVNGFILLLSHITYARRLISPPWSFITELSIIYIAFNQIVIDKII